MQQEAARKLGFNVSRTMQTAQRLYEAGHITYMRTDSVRLSETAQNSIKNAVETKFGSNYHQPRNFSDKSKNAQQAHEAVRPTNFLNNIQNLDADQSKLYDLIWRRTVASQMSDAKVDKTTVKIKQPSKLVRRVQVLQNQVRLPQFEVRFHGGVVDLHVAAGLLDNSDRVFGDGDGLANKTVDGIGLAGYVQRLQQVARFSLRNLHFSLLSVDTALDKLAEDTLAATPGVG